MKTNNNPEVVEHVAFIYEGMKSKLVDNITKMNKRAKKLGCESIQIEFTGHNEFRPVSSDHPLCQVLWLEVKLTGKTPKLADWSLIASCDHDAMIGQIFFVVPGNKVPDKYYKDTTFCDHCHTDRFRVKTFILQNIKSQQYVRVGSKCLKDFLGHKGVESFLFYASFVSTFNELTDDCGMNDGCGGRVEWYEHLETILAYSVKIIAKFGYVSNAKARDTYDGSVIATSARMWYQLDSKYNGEKVEENTEEEIEAVKPIIEWLMSQDEHASDYMHNLILIAKSGWVKWNMMGYAVSIIPCYNKAMDLIREKEVVKPSEYIGNIKDKLVSDLLFTQSFGYESDWGYVHFHKFVDKDGNHYSWRTTSSIDEVTSNWFHVKGTVKAHSEYKGFKTTELTRCKLELSTIPFWEVTK